jgi:ceramide glucosyltransferase
MPGVGLVTCLYQGTTDSRIWSTLFTMAIDFHFFPSVLLGVRMERAHPCLGATMAMRGETLRQIGGFAAFSRYLADDYAIGQAVRQTGLRVVVDRQVVLHRCSHRSAIDVFFQELRWARTIRSIDPRGYAGSLVTHPVPFSFLALACSSTIDPVAVCCVLMSLACRALLQREVERVAGMSTRRWLMGPVRDTLSLVVFVASYLTNVVVWRGRRYRVRRDGTMEEVRDRRMRRWTATASSVTQISKR